MRFFLLVSIVGLSLMPMLQAEEPKVVGKLELNVESANSNLNELPKSVDLRPQFEEFGLKPRRQGKRPTCSVFTTAAALEFAWSKQQNKSTILSVEYLNWACNKVIHKNTSRGQFFRHLLTAFDQHGICLESEMPYRRKFNPSLAPSEDAFATAKQINASHFEIHWIKRIGETGAEVPESRLNEIKQVLANGWPVAAGGSHSRLLVGYEDDTMTPGGGYFYTKDSGRGRFAQVTYEFAKNHAKGAFWVEPKEMPNVLDARESSQSD